MPQAWAAGSAFMLLQAMLGFLRGRAAQRLFVDPDLPDWLPDVTVRDLRVGNTKFDIRFWREGEETQFEVVKGGSVEVIRRKLGAAGDELRAGTHDTEEAPAQSAAVSA